MLQNLKDNNVVSDSSVDELNRVDSDVVLNTEKDFVEDRFGE